MRKVTIILALFSAFALAQTPEKPTKETSSADKMRLSNAESYSLLTINQTINDGEKQIAEIKKGVEQAKQFRNALGTEACAARSVAANRCSIDKGMVVEVPEPPAADKEKPKP